MSRRITLSNRKILATKENVKDFLQYLDEVKQREDGVNVWNGWANSEVPSNINITTVVKNPITNDENYVNLSLIEDGRGNYNIHIDEDFYYSCVDFINGFVVWKLYKQAEQAGLTYYTDSVQKADGYETVIYFYQN